MPKVSFEKFSQISESSNSPEQHIIQQKEDGLEALRSMLPTSFGAQKKTKASTEAFAKTRRKEQEVVYMLLSFSHFGL